MAMAMDGIYPPIKEIEYHYMLQIGILFSVYPECTGQYHIDKPLFSEVKK